MRNARSDRRLQRRRRDVALAFDTVLQDMLRPARAFTARAPVSRVQVLEAQPEIEQLSARLGDDNRGVDGAALFVSSPAGALLGRVRLVLVALE